jgi:hypothetical protein
MEKLKELICIVFGHKSKNGSVCKRCKKASTMEKNNIFSRILKKIYEENPEDVSG